MPLHNVVIPIKSVLNKGKTHYYNKTFEVKDGDKDKNEKYKAIWTIKIEDLKIY